MQPSMVCLSLHAQAAAPRSIRHRQGFLLLLPFSTFKKKNLNLPVTSELQPQVPAYKAPSREAAWLAGTLPAPGPRFHFCPERLQLGDQQAQWEPGALDKGAYQTTLTGLHILCLPGSPQCVGVPTGQVCMSAQGPGSSNLGFPKPAPQ